MTEQQHGEGVYDVTLYGTVAQQGIRAATGFFPKCMHCFRGVLSIFHTCDDAVRALENREVENGAAIAVFSDELSHTQADYAAIVQAVAQSDLCGKICLILDRCVRPIDASVALFCYDSIETRHNSGIDLLCNGDMLEYDLRCGRFDADITEEGFRARRCGALPSSPVITPIGRRTWAITEKYSRMFLLQGTQRGLLIDTAFGGCGIGTIAAGLGIENLVVALSHGHGDHCGGLSQFESALVAPEDWDMLPRRYTDKAGRAYSGRCHLLPLCDGQRIELGGRSVEVIACPGHTAGGRVFLDTASRSLFAGDSIAEGPTYLFMGDCSAPALLNSLQRVEERGAEFDRIYTAHRKMVLDHSIISDMRMCICGALDGTLSGESACIRKTACACEKYSFGSASVFMRRCGEQ